MTERIRVHEIRIASVPCNQIYIRHLEPWEEGHDVKIRRLQDPVPVAGPHSVQASWWPPAMLSPRWVQENHERFDIMHIHFGFDALDPAKMRALVSSLRQYDKPLVYTVHDLVNPHQADPRAHRALLDVLIPSADYLITLTQGAAAEIHATWGRKALVLPHPHVMDFRVMGQLRAERFKARSNETGARRRIGVHFKGLRPNIDPDILDPLAAVAGALPNTVLQVNIHRQVMDPEHQDHRPDLARRLLRGASQGRWELHAHEYFTEQELFEYFASLDVCVLPYRFGTHSGWLEAALDAGTRVLAPDCGHYGDQHPSVIEYRFDGAEFDRSSLMSAVEAQLNASGLAGLSVAARQDQRRSLAQTHREVYGALFAARASVLAQVEQRTMTGRCSEKNS